MERVEGWWRPALGTRSRHLLLHTTWILSLIIFFFRPKLCPKNKFCWQQTYSFTCVRSGATFKRERKKNRSVSFLSLLPGHHRRYPCVCVFPVVIRIFFYLPFLHLRLILVISTFLKTSFLHGYNFKKPNFLKPEILTTSDTETFTMMVSRFSQKKIFVYLCRSCCSDGNRICSAWLHPTNKNTKKN